MVRTLGLAFLLTVSVARASDVLVAEVRGPIFRPVLEYLTIAIEQAERDRRDAVLVELDTPGGSLETTKAIVQAMLTAPVPVVVWVSPSGAGATSAGTFVTLAAHVAAMAPGTTIGAAHPVSIPVGGSEDPVVAKKVENYAVSLIEAIAAERGRNVQWAAEAVRESASISSAAALEKGVIDLVADSREALFAAIDGRRLKLQSRAVVLRTAEPRFHEIRMTLEQAFYFRISQPTVIFVLLVLGVAAVYAEITHPGTLVPGVFGAVCLLLAAIGFSLVPVNATAAALLALGVALLVAEVFVTSFGALGIGGILCVMTGALLLFDTAETPGLAVHRGVLAATSVALAAVLLGVGSLVLRSSRRPVVTGAEGMHGAVGRVRRRLQPAGTVRIGGEIWEAELDGGGTLEEGDEVQVVRVEGLRLRVVPRARQDRRS